MNKTELMNKATRSLNRFGLKLKKHSPAICVAVGIGTGIAATVSACKATTKLHDVLDYHAEQAEKFQKGVEAGKVVTKDAEGNMSVVEYTPEDAQKDMMINKVHTVLDVAKLYAPAVALGTISIVSTLAGYKILNKRYIGASAALTAVTNDFKGYRSRVVERFGEELDRELKYNIKAVEVEETVQNEDGTETTVKKTVQVAERAGHSEYSVIFDAGCKGWTKDPTLNRFFLKQVEDWANDRLRSKGHLFLNEVREALGFDKIPMGQVVGWIYDEKNPVGDNYVSFNIFELALSNEVGSQATRNFLNGSEPNVLINFNVDGPIMDMI